MAKSGFIVGGITGAAAIILLFTFILIPSQEIGTPDLITSNGHDATTLGDTLSSSKSNLTLIELFEKSEVALNDYGVALVPGTSFGDSANMYIRLSYANSLENIEKAINRLSKI